MAYVTNECDNCVGVVAPGQVKTVNTVPVGQRRHGIATGVRLPLVSTQNRGRNQVQNDKALDASERLVLAVLPWGRYDVRLADRNGHTCIERYVDLMPSHSFDMRDCNPTDCRQSRPETTCKLR